MKLSIWYRYTKEPFGGSNNFLRRLGTALSNLGHDIYFGYRSGVDAVLINSFVCAPNKYLRVRKVSQVWAIGKINVFGYIPSISRLYTSFCPRKGPAIVHRVDGVTTLYGRKTPEVDYLTVRINRFADATIFQSEFCRQSFREFGMVPRFSFVIYNGVPFDVFYPNPDLILPPKKLNFIAVSWSSNPMKGFSTLAQLSLIPDIAVTFVGNWPEDINPEKVRILGPKNENEIAVLLREHHAFVHAAMNEPSSNAIVEALASGLPVLYRDSGGNRELVKDGGLPIRENLEASVSEFRVRYTELRTKALKQRQYFSIDFVARQYSEVITNTLKRLKNRRDHKSYGGI